MTRGIVALLQGRWDEAWHHHPFAIVFLAGWLVFLGVTISPGRHRNAVIDRIATLEKTTGVTLALLFLFAFYGLTRAAVACLDASTAGDSGSLRHQTSTQHHP